MNTDRKEIADVGDGFTEIQVEMTEELYHKALAVAQEEGCSLDELVATLLQKNIRRSASESSGTPGISTTDRTDGHEDGSIAVAPNSENGGRVGK